jgi:hypothetical protein
MHGPETRLRSLLRQALRAARRADESGQCFIQLKEAIVDRLGAMRGPGESYSDVIVRIAGREGRFDD